MNDIKQIHSSKWIFCLIVVLILVVDQATKIWIKTHMTLHECIDITGWFKICFVENNGMAYGMELGSKLLLSSIRVVLVTMIIFYVVRQIKSTVPKGYLICLSMIVGGAIGNIIDGVFYGLIFSESSNLFVADFVPFGTGYAPVLMGKVVDMLYFPLIESTWPAFVPFVGGQPFVFFSPVFNVADANISVCVCALLLFYRKRLSSLMQKDNS